jgi:hypothetical protein
MQIHGGPYSVRQGYNLKIAEEVQSQRSAICKSVWGEDCLPKIKIFCWILVHGKILTAENLKERGI